MNQDLGLTESSIHGGRPITKILVSPKDQYLITYSDDDHSFVGWDVSVNENLEEEQLKPDSARLKVINKIIIKQMCVSDEKKLAYIYIFQGWNCLSKYFHV